MDANNWRANCPNEKLDAETVSKTIQQNRVLETCTVQPSATNETDEEPNDGGQKLAEQAQSNSSLRGG